MRGLPVARPLLPERRFFYDAFGSDAYARMCFEFVQRKARLLRRFCGDSDGG
jgi:hypothetical protein